MAHPLLSARTLAAIGVLVLLAAPGFAQDSAHSDFAGTWKMDFHKSDLRQAHKGETQAVEVIPSASTMDFRFYQDGKVWNEESYAVDGNEHLLTDHPQPGGKDHVRTYYVAEWQPRKHEKDDVLEIRLRIATETSDAPSVGASEGLRATERWHHDSHFLIQWSSGVADLRGFHKVYVR
jgi:hypothetical protein